MFLTIKTTRYPATDLSFLLHKNPEKLHTFELSVGTAYVFFPEIDSHRTCAALLIDIDPIDLVKTKKFHGEGSFLLEQYVNDRPYVASSFLSMAIARVFRDGLKGICNEKPELLSEPWSFEVSISALPCRHKGKELIYQMFEPLGYEVEIHAYALSQTNPDWGEAQSYNVILKSTCFLKDLLTHLYVLIPVLDDQKHYWVAEDEVEKLLTYGQGWLKSHPMKDLIVSRYLKHQANLTQAALTQLGVEEVVPQANDETCETELSLQKIRIHDVASVLKNHRVGSVVDLGCGEGDLVIELLHDASYHHIVGVDVSPSQLARAQKKLELLPPLQKKRGELIQSSLLYVDDRIQRFDAATLIEVIEHLDPSRLSILEYVVFSQAHPGMVIITTPNKEYNPLLNVAAGSFRHPDHRFEWTRKEFRNWAEKLAHQYGYTVTFHGIGPLDEGRGCPTQMGIFT